MTYSAATLVTNAYYLAGIVAEDNENVSRSQLTKGLRLLNAMLSRQATTGRMIPYFQSYQFNTVIGQEKYFIENLILIEPLTFNIGSVRFPTTYRKRDRYFGSGRADNIRSLPVSWEFERTKGGADIRFYFTPDKVYPIKFVGKFGLESVLADDDLEEVYDGDYIEYLEYLTAKRICQNNTVSFPPDAQQDLKEAIQKLRDKSPLDLSMKKLSTLQRGSSFTYADANIGRGWRP